MKKSYAVETTFTYTGKFFVYAENEDEARELVMGKCHQYHPKAFSSLPLDDVGWEFPHVSNKTIDKITQKEQVEIPTLGFPDENDTLN